MNTKQKKIAEQALDNLVEFYIKKNPTLSAPTVDGRLNSASNESEILNDIDSYFKSGNPWIEDNGLYPYFPNTEDNRAWFDFAILSENDETFFAPVNVKSTEMKSPDNLSCKLGIFWALSGKKPENVGLSNTSSWEKYHEILYSNIKKQNSDYYFFVVNKNDTKTTFWNSLRQLEILTPNANNLPFQCHWGKIWTESKELLKKLLLLFLVHIKKVSIETPKE